MSLYPVCITNRVHQFLRTSHLARARSRYNLQSTLVDLSMPQNMHGLAAFSFINSNSSALLIHTQLLHKFHRHIFSLSHQSFALVSTSCHASHCHFQVHPLDYFRSVPQVDPPLVVTASTTFARWHHFEVRHERYYLEVP